MPNSIIRSFSKKTGISKEKIEKYWEDIKKALIKQGYSPEKDKNFYGLLVSILKKKLKIKEKTLYIQSFREFLNETYLKK